MTTSWAMDIGSLTDAGTATLSRHLLDLAVQLQAAGVKLTVVGGMGLVLMRHLVLQGGARRLESGDVPQRSTRDIDLCLDTDTLADQRKVLAIHEALQLLDYKPVPTARFFQFERGTGTATATRLDLVAPPPLATQKEFVVRDGIRIKPVRSPGGARVHARVASEVVGLTENSLALAHV